MEQILRNEMRLDKNMLKTEFKPRNITPMTMNQLLGDMEKRNEQPTSAVKARKIPFRKVIELKPVRLL